MTETPYQISDKIGDAIVVVRGNSRAEFVQNLQSLAQDPEALMAVNAFSSALKGTTPSSPQQAYQNLQQGLGAQPVQQQAAPWEQDQMHHAGAMQAKAPWQQQAPQQVTSQQTFTCPHGVRIEKTGTSAKGPWTAYMCPAKVDGCKPMRPDGTFWAR